MLCLAFLNTAIYGYGYLIPNRSFCDDEYEEDEED